MTYKEFIEDILNNRGRFNIPNGEYKERHHIIPKCLGGNNTKDNLIDLYAHEHFEAHRLLALENPKHRGLCYSWFRMSHYHRVKCTAKEYEETKLAYDMFLKEHPEVIFKPDVAGEKNPMWGKTHSDEYKARLRATMKGEGNHFYGKKHTEETRKKISNAVKGKNHPFYGTHRSEETRRKIGDGNRGKVIPMEQRQKIKENHADVKRGKHPQARKVYCVELDKIYDCIRDAEEELQMASGHICRCCQGKRKSAGKHPITNEKLHWEYVN